MFALKKVSLTGLLFLLFASNVSAVPFKFDYTLEGQVIGIVSRDVITTPCYISIRDIHSAANSNYYHAMASSNQCNAALEAYSRGLNVKIWALNAPENNSNDVIALEIHSGEVKWFK
ncbi:hypothetical protein IM288_22095 [Enterobacter cloacae complex sp. P32C]|uniref:hypothetical protein n=1 Tax=Enterobacter cloacae complex sp. P32C TaxID=2779559 RepID=UPI0018687AA9|nr:hypothetical protein [Enterobacter cloacae complex sp. P32C]MBE3211145.1 hypothetical protein [Enterobacter cloacae complex sp. P32C]